MPPLRTEHRLTASLRAQNCPDALICNTNFSKLSSLTIRFSFTFSC
jgi:hypothetical protein